MKSRVGRRLRCSVFRTNPSFRSEPQEIRRSDRPPRPVLFPCRPPEIKELSAADRAAIATYIASRKPRPALRNDIQNGF